MAVTLGPSDSDLYFSIDDEAIRDCLRQLYDNVRILRAEVISLKERVLVLETEKDTDLP